MKITRDRIKQLVEQEVEKTQADVERISQRLGSVSGLENLLDKVNTRVEFEQFLTQIIRVGSKNVKPQDMAVAIRNVYNKLRKEM